MPTHKAYLRCIFCPATIIVIHLACISSAITARPLLTGQDRRAASWSDSSEHRLFKKRKMPASQRRLLSWDSDTCTVHMLCVGVYILTQYSTSCWALLGIFYPTAWTSYHGGSTPCAKQTACKPSTWHRFLHRTVTNAEFPRAEAQASQPSKKDHA